MKKPRARIGDIVVFRKNNGAEGSQGTVQVASYKNDTWSYKMVEGGPEVTEGDIIGVFSSVRQYYE